MAHVVRGPVSGCGRINEQRVRTTVKSDPARSDPITLADVAQAAGVSAMTVSKVMRGKGRISPNTIQRVMRIAQELGYVPNRLAGSLSSRSSNCVAVVLPSINDMIFGELVSGVNAVLRPLGLSTIIAESHFDPEAEHDAVRTMLSLQPAGVIINGGIARMPETEALLAKWDCPVVEVWDTAAQAFDYCVGPSHRMAGEKVAKHFIDRRFKRPAYIGAELQKDICASRRYRGFSQAMQAAGLDVVSVIDETLQRQPETGRILAERLMQAAPETDAIYFLNDAMAVGGLSFLHENDIAVPQRVATAGFNGTSRAHAISTFLTTVDIDRRRVGEMAAEGLMALMEGKPIDPVTVIPTHFVQGNTS